MTQKSAKLVCASCGKKVAVVSIEADLLPFCSKRCKMIDLGKWLGEKYVVGTDHASLSKKTHEE